MEELDLLKKDWKKNGDNFPKVSEKEIYAMLHKNSSSVVKWILLISICEFAFFLALTLLLNDNAGTRRMESYLTNYMMIGMSVIDYSIMVYFLCMFYINYKKIAITDKVKNLMANILKTRKTVSNYILVKIVFIIILFIIMFIAYFNNDPELRTILHHSEENGKGPMVYLIYFAVAIISIAVFAFVTWLFYKIIYGLLLKQLRKNYDELKKIDL
jgi:magnesium-transporting ATPase (P-type)